MGEENFPKQHQEKQPGKRTEMNPKPLSEDFNYQGCGKLKGKTLLITGGDSGIGRAVSILFAKEAHLSQLHIKKKHEMRKIQRSESSNWAAI